MKSSNFIQHLINAAIFILLEIAALSMLRHNGRMQDLWISEGAHAVMGAVWGSTQNVADYFSLRKRNDALAQENHELRVRLARLEAMTAEAYGGGVTGGEWPEGVAGEYRYIPAVIVKSGENMQHNYLIIGKGSDDGVKVGSGVMTGKGAVGVIDAVGRKYSYARSFKNHEMSISSRIGKVGAVGPLSWDGRSSSGAVLKEIPHHVEFAPGDTVYTSGYSSIFPPDIPLGTAGEARIVNGATYEIEVTLFEDFGALRYVSIVENMGKDAIRELEEQ